MAETPKKFSNTTYWKMIFPLIFIFMFLATTFMIFTTENPEATNWSSNLKFMRNANLKNANLYGK